SKAMPETCTVSNLWLGGQRVVGLAETVSTGGVRSIRIVSEPAGPTLPLWSVETNVIRSTPFWLRKIWLPAVGGPLLIEYSVDSDEDGTFASFAERLTVTGLV